MTENVWGDVTVTMSKYFCSLHKLIVIKFLVALTTFNLFIILSFVSVGESTQLSSIEPVVEIYKE